MPVLKHHAQQKGWPLVDDISLARSGTQRYILYTDSDSGEGAMEPVSLIVAALLAGATAGASEAAREFALAAYRDLRERVRARLADREDGRLVLDRFEQEPAAWGPPLRAELTAVGAGDDAQLVAAAQRVLDAVGDGGAVGAKYLTHFHGEVGSAVVGDAARVDVTINRAAERAPSPPTESGRGPDPATPST
ncbi:hypothetical protein ACIQPR_05880 [Streptomyces sp. NPDC091280]|uniref:hypothetical protein n=1 Tax=Streptomyces sp. NPDC091280 TaxID=3365984 RepID=UPI00381BC332